MDRITTLKLALLFISVHGANGKFPCSPSDIVISAVSSTELLVKWTCQDGGQASQSELEYQVEHQLTTLGQCDIRDGRQQPPFDIRLTARDRLVGSTTDDAGMTLIPGNFRYSLTLSDLLPYSTYRIKIFSYSREYPNTHPEESTAQYQMTSEAAPAEHPFTMGYTFISTNVYEFNWNPPSCEKRNGKIQHYVYMLIDQDNSILSSGTTESTTIRISNVPGCINLTFRVAATTVTDGPFADVDIIDQSVPITIGSLTSSGVSSTGFTVSWDPPDTGCPITRYLVRNILVLQDQCLNIPDPMTTGTYQTANTMHFTGLIPYSTYSVSVTPENNEGLGTPVSIDVETEQTAPKVPPRNIQYTSSSQDRHVFNWDTILCGERNGEVQHYTYMVVTKGNPVNAVSSGMTDRTSVTISDVMECSDLTFKVAASTISDGPFGNVDFNDRSVPGAIGSFSSSAISATGFTLSWDPPDTGCPATQYLVRHILVLQDQCMDNPDQMTTSEYQTSNTVHVTGLKPYSTYTVSVTPDNNQGPGRASTMYVETKQKAPTVEPQNLQVSLQRACSLEFGWNKLPCGSTGGGISYKYELNNILTGHTQTGSPTIENVSIESLNCLTDYRFRVKAQNAGGEGPWTDYAQTSTTLTASDFGIIPGKTQLHVSWVVSSSNCTCTTTNTIEYILTDAGQCGQIQDGDMMREDTTSNTVFTLTDLLPYSRYIVYVTPLVEGRNGEMGSIEGTTLSSQPVVGPKVTVDESLITSSSIHFAWEEIPCESRGSPIIKYNFNLTDGSIIVADDTTHSYDESTRSVNITLLAADHLYNFSISATNTLGPGPNTIVTAYTSQRGPNPPREVALVTTGKTHLKFSWNTASCGDLNGCESIAGYSYTLIALPDGGKVDQMTTETNVMISNLKPCTMYEFRVAASSDSGMTGSYGEAVLGTTAVDVPIPVSNIVRGDQTTSSTLVITWTKPNGPCPVDTYYIQYSIYERDMCQQFEQDAVEFGTVETTCVEIPNLKSFSTYMAWITPQNEEGFGQRQSASISTDEQRPSDAPVNVKSTSVWSRNASFVWDEVQCGSRHGNITQYSSQIATTSDSSVIENQVTLTQTTTFHGLQPCTAYTFRVAAMTDAGAGPMSTGILIMTTNIKPLAVTFPQIVDFVLSSTARFQWNPSSTDSPGSCPADEYLVEYQLINIDQCEDVDNSPLELYGTSNTTEITLSKLKPYSTYVISVTARNDVGESDVSTMELNTAIKEPSGAPLNVMASDKQKQSLAFEWSLPACGERHGNIVMYFYQLQDRNTILNGNTTNTEVVISKLLPFVNYTFRVAAATYAGQGPLSQSFVTQTDEDVPSAPTDLRLVPSTSIIKVTWEKPDPPYGNLLKYYIEYWISSDKNMSKTNVTLGSKTTFTLSGLRLGDDYSVRVQGETSAGKGLWSGTETVTTSIPKPQPPNVMVSDNSVIIVIDKLPEYISNVYIAAQQVTSRRRRQSDGDAYIVANLTRGDIDESSSFTVGDNETYGSYKNRELENNAIYNISVAYVSCSTNKCFKTWSDPATVQVPPLTEEQIGPNSGGVLVNALVPIVIVMFIVVLLTVATILKRDKIRSTIAERPKNRTKDEEMAHENPAYDDDIKEKDETNLHSDSVENPIPDVEPINEPPAQPSPILTPATPSGRRKTPKSQKQPGTPVPTRKVRRNNVIPVDKIKEYIHEQTSGDRNGFVEEFKEIPGDSQIHGWNDAELVENYRNKNRFINIMPYDHSRVKLEIGGEDPVLNFINASLIKVYDDKCFIATHGPLPDIFEDTWQLVWEQNVTKIIMVTNLVEKKMIKCHKYWPDVVTTYGQFEVRPLAVEKYANYTIRGFRLSMVDEEKAMEIKQFHFTSWPDFGVPAYPTPLLNFMKAVNAFDPPDSGPPIIHCSAGVGRTGTYITIDSMMKMARDTGNINVPDFVAQIRDFRINMVQTSHQYQFIYEALYEALLLDNTSILVTNLREEHMKLSAKIKKGEDKGKTGFELELRILNELTYRPVGDQGAGADPSNTDKNRFPDKIPDEKDRPSLATPGDEDSTDYINAAYLDSRRLKDIFLATQMPMPNTQGDIWRMVYDHYSHVIVMLNDMDNKDATIAKYWPEEASVISVGSLQIDFQSTQKLDDKIIGRTFKITNTQFPDQDSRIVLQLQYTDWPADKDVPNSAETFLALASLVQNHHDQNDNVGPITVHCMNGLGRSGVFCALLSVIDKMKSDKMVDVFQEVKRLRMSRSGMVENVKQYKFLYDVALVYLDQYGSYENFSPTGSLMHGQKPPSANGVFGESSETESTEGDHASNQ